MESKHTKGEWKYHQTFRGDYSININDESIANVWCLENDENYTDEANAKLIAAAPELLESLINMVKMYEETEPSGGYQGYYELAKIAINKAYGK